MAERVLRVSILGDSRDIEKAFARSAKSAEKFSKGQTNSVRDITRAEESLIRVRSKRASSIGLFRLGAVGLGAGAGLVAATQVVREIGSALETTGEAAFTTEGRLKNMASALTTGNLVGAIQSLTRTPQTLEELGISAVYATAQIEALRKVADGSAATLRDQGDAAVKGATLFGLHSAAIERSKAIEDAAGTSSRKLAQELLDGRDAAIAASVAMDALADSGSRLGEKFFTATGAVTTFKGAVDDLAGPRGPGARAFETPFQRQGLPTLPPLAPSQRRELDLIGKEGTRQIPLLKDRLRQLNNQMKDFHGNQEQRLKILTNIANTEAEIASIYADQAAAREAAAAAAKREAEAARAAASAALAETRERNTERLARAAGRRQTRQFAALGLGPGGGELVPTRARLRKEIGTLSETVEGTFLDTAKTRTLFATMRRIISETLVPPEVRSKMRDMLADLRQQLKDHAQSGPLTAFHKANANALLAGLGLSPDETRALRARLSRVGVGGTVAAGSGGAFGIPFAAGAGGGGVQFQAFVSVDGGPFERAVTKRQQVRRARNPQQKRGPAAAQ